MDLTRPVTYRGLDINDVWLPDQAGQPVNGFRLDDARFLPVNGVGYKEKRSLADGFDAARVFLGMRQVFLRGTLFRLTKAELHDSLRLLRQTFNPVLAYADDPINHGYLPLRFKVPTTDAYFESGFIDAQVYARPVDMPGTMYPRDAAYGADGRGFSEVFEVMLDCVDPRIYNQTATTITLDNTSGNGTTENHGDYQSPLLIETFASADQTGSRTLHITGFGTSMTVTIPEGFADRTVIVDSAKKVATMVVDGNETLRMDLVQFDAGFTWPLCQPGSNIYDYTTTGGATTAAIIYREAFC